MRLAVARRTLLALGLLASIAAPNMAEAASVVDMLRWDGVGTMPVWGKVAPAHFRLSASVRWSKDAERDFNRYRVLVQPEGSPSASFPLEKGESPGPDSKHLVVWVPAEAVRNRLANDVKVAVSIVDAQTGEQVSRNFLTAGIEQFPRPNAEADAPTEAFGWGTPLSPTVGGAQKLARRPERPDAPIDLNEGPQGLQFTRVFRDGDRAGFFVANAEARLDQVRSLLSDKDYRPNLRAAEFFFSNDSPAIGLSPALAKSYLDALGNSEGRNLSYRLPTKDEWLRAAKAGRSTTFWWGDDPDDEAAKLGANFKGLERPEAGSGRAEDAVDVVRPTASGGQSLGGFRANPWGLWHTFGNVGEWATDPAGDGFWNMGGDFRTERTKANFRPEDLEIHLKSGDEFNAEKAPFIGVRPVVEVSPEQGKAAIETALQRAEASAGEFDKVVASYNPETATATLTGTVLDPAARLRAGAALRSLWFLAAVTDRLGARREPVVGNGVAAIDGEAVSLSVACGHVPSGRVYEVPAPVRWGHRLPVDGSEYWINVYRPESGEWISGARVTPGAIGRAAKLNVPIEGAKMAALGLPVTAPVLVALSLGKEPARATNDSRIVSNVAVLKWSIEADRDCPENVRKARSPRR